MAYATQEGCLKEQGGTPRWLVAIFNVYEEHRRPLLVALGVTMALTGTLSVKIVNMATSQKEVVVTKMVYREVVGRVLVKQKVRYSLVRNVKDIQDIREATMACKQRLATLRLVMGEKSFKQVVGRGNCGESRRVAKLIRLVKLVIKEKRRSRRSKRRRLAIARWRRRRRAKRARRCRSRKQRKCPCKKLRLKRKRAVLIKK